MKRTILSLLSRLSPVFLRNLVVVKKRIDILYQYVRYRLKPMSKKNVEKDPFNVPIIINNFNRLEYLLKLIHSLETRGYTNIYIIDNHSSYPPLLEYYKICPYTIYRLNKNVGYKAIWETGIFHQFKHDYYVYTDSDMQIDECCPKDFIEHFIKILKRYPTAQKIGFGIKIDDIPDYYINKNQVIEWENQYWNHEVEHGLFRASIDTTFALYRPFCKGEADSKQKVFRTGYPYLIKHLPWYCPANLSDEEKYYLSSITQSTHWSQKNAPKSNHM